MKRFKHITSSTVAASILVVAGCGGGGGSYSDGGTGMTPPPPVTAPPPPPPVTTTDFTLFTRDLMVSARTNDTDDPVELESIEWVFADDENEATYDDIITASEP